MFPATTKIILADDTSLMRTVETRILTNLGFKDITSAEDGEAAFTLIQAALTAGKPFELILSDWMMPKLKGIDLLKKVRAVPAYSKTPFILVTAEIEKQQVMEAVQAGVTNYITKPFTEETFGQKLKATYDALFAKKSA